MWWQGVCGGTYSIVLIRSQSLAKRVSLGSLSCAPLDGVGGWMDYSPKSASRIKP